MARVKVVHQHEAELFGCLAYRLSAPFRRSGEAAGGELLSYVQSTDDDERS